MKSMRFLVALSLAASVTFCLSSGMAYAGEKAKSEHSCCPGGGEQKGPDQAGSDTGFPRCCLVLASSPVLHAVLVKSGLHACANVERHSGPALKSLESVVTVSSVLRQFLTRLILSIRAPPQA